MVDESLIKDTIAAGCLRKQTIRRLVTHIDSAAQHVTSGHVPHGVANES